MNADKYHVRRERTPFSTGLTFHTSKALEKAEKVDAVMLEVANLVFSKSEPNLTALREAYLEAVGQRHARPCPQDCGGITFGQPGGGIACNVCTYWFCY